MHKYNPRIVPYSKAIPQLIFYLTMLSQPFSAMLIAAMIWKIEQMGYWDIGTSWISNLLIFWLYTSCLVVGSIGTCATYCAYTRESDGQFCFNPLGHFLLWPSIAISIYIWAPISVLLIGWGCIKGFVYLYHSIV
jgi:hypothetical protein